MPERITWQQDGDAWPDVGFGRDATTVTAYQLELVVQSITTNMNTSWPALSPLLMMPLRTLPLRSHGQGGSSLSLKHPVSPPPLLAPSPPFGRQQPEGDQSQCDRVGSPGPKAWLGGVTV